MTHNLDLCGANLTWEGVVDVVATEDGWVLWRLRADEEELLHPKLVTRAQAPSGVRLRFVSDARKVRVRVRQDAEMSRVCGMEIHVNGEEKARGLVEGESVVEAEADEAGENQWEIRFPSTTCTIREVALEGNGVVKPWPHPGPKWVTYGSSITHCRNTPYPSETWPAIVARNLGLNWTSLGFGGQCHVDPLVARVMRDRPADYLSMCVGINVYGSASLGQRSFIPNVHGFVQIVRENHPETPLGMISPIYSEPRETDPNPLGWTLTMMREALHEAVEVLRRRGDQNVFYVDGLEIFGPEEAHLLPDQLHPNTQGYALMGGRLTDALAEGFGLKARS